MLKSWTSVLLVAVCCQALWAVGPDRGPATRYLTQDGAWCWFSDPRAVFYHGLHRRTYGGWITSKGDVQVFAYDHQTGQIQIRTIHQALEVDDHDNPAVLILPDGRIAVFYTRHGGKEMFMAVTTGPEDITSWQPVRVLPFRPDRFGICYSNPVMLAGQRNRIYLFWRGLDYKPTFSWSDDFGQTWADQRQLITSTGARPYLKVSTDGSRTIHLAFTDGHPRDEPTNSIYYMAYKDGVFCKADGTFIADINGLPIDRRSADVVYDGQKDKVRAWVWDVAVDVKGRPVIVYARLPSETDHRYHYAWWDGRAWQDIELCKAGRWFPQTPEGQPEREPHYSGGLVLDHEEPSVVYLSRQVPDGNGRFQIERYRIEGGLVQQQSIIAADPGIDHVRPFVVRGHQEGGPTVLWLCIQRYRHYTDYLASVGMAFMDQPR